jgi:hypothetical protein
LDRIAGAERSGAHHLLFLQAACGNMMATSTNRSTLVEQEFAMRAGMVGRWLGRAAMIVALGIGFLAVGGAGASADTGPQPGGTVAPMEFDWN